MQPNTYPDGFPQKPIDAIDFSYFLSDEEKLDWKQWLDSSTPEQQYELVDTLHAMWQENQKNAIPNGFSGGSPSGNTTPSNGQNQTPPTYSSTQTVQGQTNPSDYELDEKSYKKTLNNTNYAISQEPVEIQQSYTTQYEGESNLTSTQNPPYNSNVPESQDEFASSRKDQVNQATSQQNNRDDGLDQLTKNQKFNTTADNAARDFGRQAYTPNPLLDDNSDSQVANQMFSDQAIAEEPSSVQKSYSPSSTTKSSKPFFNVTKLRESATKQELEGLYSQYVQLRESNFTNTYSFYEAQGKILDKIMSVVVNFEKVADFFDSLSEKLIEVNDKLVNQVKDYNTIKGTITTQQGNIVDEVGNLRHDVDRLFRTIREDKTDNRRQFEEIKTSLATIGADSFGSDNGLLQRYDLLSSQLHKLELKITRGDTQQVNQTTFKSASEINLVPTNTRQTNTPISESQTDTAKTNISINAK